MTKYARLDGNRAIDVITTNPEESFHPDLLRNWTFLIVPDDTENGDFTDDGGRTFRKPEPPAPVE